MNLENNVEAIEFLSELLEKIAGCPDPVNQKIITVKQKQGIVSDLILGLNQWDTNTETADLAIECLRSLCREVIGSEPFFNDKVTLV